MATRIETGKVYKCKSPMIGNCIVQVIGGTVKLMGSNVTEYDPDTQKLVIPEFSDLMETGDELSEGIHPLAGLCEWFGFEGDAEAVWVKMGVDARIDAK